MTVITSEDRNMLLLLVCGNPPAIRTPDYQVWCNATHRWMLERGMGSDAIERARIVDEFIVWLAFKELGL